MRIRKILFLSIFLILGLVLFMPNTVNADVGEKFYDNGFYCEILTEGENKTVKIETHRGSETNIIIPIKVKYKENDYTVTQIGRGSFVCSSMEKVTFQDDSEIKVIDECAFEGCKNLISVDNLPNTLTTIGAYAFQLCSKLEDIIIPKYVTQIGEDAFWGCNSLTIYGYMDSTAHRYAELSNIPFEEILYSLTFDANGGAYRDDTTQKIVDINVLKGFPSFDNPIREDYIFSGYVDENGKSLDKYINGEAKFNNGMKFKAEWIELVDEIVINFTTPIKLSGYEWALLDILKLENIIKITSDYIADASGKTLATQTTDGKAVSADNLTVSDNISYNLTESDFKQALTYNNADTVGKITEIPRKIELVFAYPPVEVILGNNAILDGTKAHIISIKTNGNSMTSIEYKLKGENQYKTLAKGKDYTIESPVEIALTPDFLKTLSEGEYELIVNYSSNTKANVTFTIDKSQADNNVSAGAGIQQPAQPAQPVQNQATQTNNPQTGDTITLWIGVLVISLSGLVLINKKK